jgi:hypothetical protein
MTWTIGLTVAMLILLYKFDPSYSCTSVIHLVPVSDLVGRLYLTTDDDTDGAMAAGGDGAVAAVGSDELLSVVLL